MPKAFKGMKGRRGSHASRRNSVVSIAVVTPLPPPVKNRL